MNTIKARILVVEDEPKVLSFIKLGLEENGFWVETAGDGVEGKKLIERKVFDLVILDVKLPYKSGLELCKELRLNNDKMPVLMLTAMGSTDDKLKGFESGADDYLLKPFEFSELLARLKALLKRTTFVEKEVKVLKFSDLEMNLFTFEVKRGGKRIELTQKEFVLLEYMIKNKERVLTRTEIAQNVWNINFDSGTNVIDVYMNFLRKKIDKDFDVKLIHTKVGTGYILRQEVYDF